ncbi:Hypothetical protein A7982_06476 [Minicystis rosea]|nr:Hypothetical protein A7982_06476 [Minicystis rosea]
MSLTIARRGSILRAMQFPISLSAFFAGATLLAACGTRTPLLSSDATSSGSGGTMNVPGDTGGGTTVTSSSSSSTSTSATSSSSTGGIDGGVTTFCGELAVVWSVALAQPDEPVFRVMDVDPQGNVFVMSGNGVLDRIGPDGVLQQHNAIGLVNGLPRYIVAANNRVLLGPMNGSTTYRALLAPPDAAPKVLWDLDVQVVGLTPGIWGSRGIVTTLGSFGVGGISGANLVLGVLGDNGKSAWKAQDTPAQTFGWMIGADAAGGVMELAPPNLMRRNAGGAAVWSIPYDPLTATVGDIVAAPSGDLYVFGVTDFPVDPVFSVGRISPAGQLLWRTPIVGGSDENFSCGLAPLADGGAVVCAAFEHGGVGLQRFSADGVPLWAPTDWVALPCAELGNPWWIDGSPDGSVVVLTENRVVKLAPPPQ